MGGDVGVVERGRDTGRDGAAYYLCPTGRSGHAAWVPAMWADLISALEIGKVFAQPEAWAFLNKPDTAEVTHGQGTCVISAPRLMRAG